MPEKQFKMVFADYIQNKKTQNVKLGTNLSMETVSSVRQISVILIKMKPNLSHVICLVITVSPGLNDVLINAEINYGCILRFFCWDVNL